MTLIPEEIHKEINNKLVSVIGEYQGKISQWDLLMVTSTFLGSVINTISKHDNVAKDEVLSDALVIIKKIIGQ